MGTAKLLGKVNNRLHVCFKSDFLPCDFPFLVRYQLLVPFFCNFALVKEIFPYQDGNFKNRDEVL